VVKTTKRDELNARMLDWAKTTMGFITDPALYEPTNKDVSIV
jgi:hypothetical protein